MAQAVQPSMWTGTGAGSRQNTGQQLQRPEGSQACSPPLLGPSGWREAGTPQRVLSWLRRVFTPEQAGVQGGHCIPRHLTNLSGKLPPSSLPTQGLPDTALNGPRRGGPRQREGTEHSSRRGPEPPWEQNAWHGHSIRTKRRFITKARGNQVWGVGTL